MNDTKARENAYIASCAEVERQQKVVDEAATNVSHWRESYLNAVVAAAAESEKLHRKKDMIVVLVWVGIVLAVALITLIFFGGVGAIGVIVGFTGIAILIERSEEDAREAENRGRKEFFTKYHASLPQDTHLNRMVVQAPSQAQAAAALERLCPYCNAKNTLGSVYCASCGRKMP